MKNTRAVCEHCRTWSPFEGQPIEHMPLTLLYTTARIVGVSTGRVGTVQEEIRSIRKERSMELARTRVVKRIPDCE